MRPPRLVLTVCHIVGRGGRNNMMLKPFSISYQGIITGACFPISSHHSDTEAPLILPNMGEIALDMDNCAL